MGTGTEDIFIAARRLQLTDLLQPNPLLLQNLRHVPVNPQSGYDAPQPLLDHSRQIPVIFPDAQIKHDLLTERFILDQEGDVGDVDVFVAGRDGVYE